MSLFPIVGIGASAGGLEAFTKLLSNLPLDTGMAFILVQHLDPKHESMSTEILSRTTKLAVAEVKDKTPVEANHIYILPPNFDMQILDGVLRLTTRTEVRGQHLVIDSFFRSLAEDQKNLVIGVVLSGTGSDGTRGLSAIKLEGGITFAQTPGSSRFRGMPESAIQSGNVDYVLSPEDIAKELTRIAKHPHAKVLAPNIKEINIDHLPKLEESLSHIFLLLRKHCHVDFTFYKSNTVMRRIDRQMVLHKIKDLKAYADFLDQNSKEVEALCGDILIHVTGFFRDTEAYEALNTEVFPKLLEKRKLGVPIRIWSPGCSTGEEPYSLAIALLEFLGDKVSHTPIQIFATDISEESIKKARLGEYSETIVNDISAERLSRYFVKLENGRYRILKSIRDFCVFSRHDITADPPFAKIDMISCRNLMIYFSPILQKHVIPAFHYSLMPNGFLLLGKSETIGGFSDLFSLVDKVNKIYQRKDAPVSLKLRFPTSTFAYGKQDGNIKELKSFPKPIQDIHKIVETTFFAEFPGVVVNEEMEILQICGKTHPFIAPASGTPSYNILKMAHADLSRYLRVALEAVKKSKKSTLKESLSLTEGRKEIIFNLRVVPIEPTLHIKRHLYLVLFEKVPESDKKTKRRKEEK
jgi:two-component system, chemotaxis family, CheB/CheR fusion protein